MIKLLIVDDSALMRRQLATIFNEDGGFELRMARNGLEAVQENIDWQPDVVTLDINMPEMDGITALSLLMAERPVPVIMVSSLTEKGALATFEALALGAVDYVAKPGGTISLSIEDIKHELIRKIKMAAKARLKTSKSVSARLRSEHQTVRAPAVVKRTTSKEGVVLIGVSTGGPRTLEDILPKLPQDFPWPIIVAQHMPASFTLPFAKRMNDLCALNVVEASSPMFIEPGTVYIGKGGADIVLVKRGNQLSVMAKPENAQYLWHPSVELLGRSALEYCDPANVIGVMLTGMGYDGAEAFTEIKNRGGRTIAESEMSAVVFGMPAELIERGGATIVLTADKIANQINSWLT